MFDIYTDLQPAEEIEIFNIQGGSPKTFRPLKHIFSDFYIRYNGPQHFTAVKQYHTHAIQVGIKHILTLV